MKNVLIISASANRQNSISRRLCKSLVINLSNMAPFYRLCYRDLATNPIAHIDQQWLLADSKATADRSAQDIKALELSDTLIGELRKADLIILATPMYNWSVPSSLKAYLDQVLRFNETFSAASAQNNKRYLGLLQDKRLLLLLSRGSLWYASGEENAHMDYQSSYLKMVFGIMGVERIHEFTINGTKRPPSQLEPEIQAMELELCAFIQKEFDH